MATHPTRSSLETLEARIAPAILFGITGDRKLISFDSTRPGVLLSSASITGVDAQESIVGMDFRPATGGLYFVTTNAAQQGHLYTLDPATGAASLVNASALEVPLTGTAFDIDFNPMVDRLRLVSNTGLNLRINPATGQAVDSDGSGANGVTPDISLQYDAADANAGKTPSITGLAYTNSYAGATSTRLFDLDTTLGLLAEQTNPNGGTLATRGKLNASTPSARGFDILPGSTTGFAALDAAGQDRLFSINLATGAARFLGRIGPAGTDLLSLAALPSGLSISGKTATYTDVDGDLVRLTVSKGTLTRSLFTFTAPNELGGVQLQKLDLTVDAAGFAGTALSLTAAISPLGGNGFVDVGQIVAQNMALQAVSVKGDLGALTVGLNNNPNNTPAVGTLKVGSVGVVSGTTPVGVTRGLEINGPAGTFTSTGSVAAGVSISGKVGSLTIGGALTSDLDVVGTVNALSLGRVQFADVNIFGSVGSLRVDSLNTSTLSINGGVTTVLVAGDMSNATLRVNGLLPVNASPNALAVGSLTVNGSVLNSQILISQLIAFAYSPSGAVGQIRIGHDWAESNLSVGVSAGNDDQFGTADDEALSFGDGRVGQIARLIIAGEVSGNADGLVASKIASATLGGNRVALTDGFDQKPLGASRTVMLREYRVIPI